MSACNGRPGFDPWVRMIPWRRKRQPTPVCLPGEAYGQRSLVVYSPWGHKEMDTTERLQFTSLHFTSTAITDFFFPFSHGLTDFCLLREVFFSLIPTFLLPHIPYIYILLVNSTAIITTDYIKFYLQS